MEKIKWNRDKRNCQYYSTNETTLLTDSPRYRIVQRNGKYKYYLYVNGASIAGFLKLSSAKAVAELLRNG